MNPQRACLLAMILLTLVGCGGLFGHGGASITDERRSAVLDEITAKFQSLPKVDPNADNQTMLAFLKGIPEITSSGISDDSCIWGQFADGREVMVINNTDPPHGRSRAARTRAPSGLPYSPNVRIMTGLGTCFDDIPAGIEAELTAAGYQVAVEDASVENLLSLKSSPPGVFYLTTHGGTAHGTQPYALYTTTPQSTANDRTEPYRSLLRSGELRYCIANNNLDNSGTCIAEKHYGITTKFVRNQMRFGVNSLVFVDACTSNTPSLRTEFLNSGASVYAGWTAPVTNTLASDATQFVFDRMLGANLFNPDLSLRHSIDYLAIKQAMHSMSPPLDSETNHGVLTELMFTASSSPESDLGVLAPGIESLNVDRANKLLIIDGLFGKDPVIGGSVTVGGTGVNVRFWNPSSITCDLPDTGPGSTGYVVVTVRGHKSNSAGPVTSGSNQGTCQDPEGDWRGDVTVRVLSTGHTFNAPYLYRITKQNGSYSGFIAVNYGANCTVTGTPWHSTSFDPATGALNFQSDDGSVQGQFIAYCDAQQNGARRLQVSYRDPNVQIQGIVDPSSCP